MADLIERDALLLKQKAHVVLFADSTVHDDTVRRDEAIAALAEIINAPAVNRWISCSERMPAEWQIVAAYGEKIGLKCVEWHPEMGVFIDTQSEYDDQIKPEYFTRWIPLTEHPEKE